MNELLPILATLENLISQLKNVDFGKLEADGQVLSADAQKIMADAMAAGQALSAILADLQAAFNKQGK